jgi:molecular chaperone GrpE
MIKNQIEDLLRRRGLEKIKIKVGDNFDPSLAEAIAEVESEFPPGSIAEEIDPGYRLHDKLIRPARVKISKSKLI